MRRASQFYPASHATTKSAARRNYGTPCVSPCKNLAGYVPPASHFASSLRAEDLPPMGMRVRLKASFDTSRFTGAARVILEGLKKYGMILADNGSDWFISGAPDGRWKHEELTPLRKVTGNDFEVVKMGPLTTK